MLANILPGLRDLRAPLIAGYVFLVSLWFFVSPSTAAPKGNSGYALGYHLGQFAGRAAVLAAASVAAFFIGLLLQQTGQVVTLLYSTLYYRFTADVELNRAYKSWGASPRSEPGDTPDSPPYLEPSDIPSFVLGRLGAPTALRLANWLRQPPTFNLQDFSPEYRQTLRGIAQREFFHRWNVREQIRKVVDEIPLISSRMRDLAKERFQEFDKLRSEAEFREALSPAIVVLAVALIIRWSPWWGLLLLFVVWLQNEARRLRVQANSVAIEAVISVPGLYPSRDDLAANALEAASIPTREAPPPTKV